MLVMQYPACLVSVVARILSPDRNQFSRRLGSGWRLAHWALALAIGAAWPITAFALEAPVVQGYAKRIWRCDTASLEEFTQLAERAAAAGATHVFVSDLPKSRWQWERDLSDPYPNWGMMHSSIFKVIVPPELQRWLPADYAKKNLEIVVQRCAILKRFGLKAAFSACEPGWLPEEAYQEHPDWRGPRCDHTRRARHAYYSPDIDNPEVLAMYRKAIAELCRQAPIEYFNLLTNDSGGGLCWSLGLYPGPNGPESCRTRGFPARVAGFLSVIQAGAADAGLSNVEVRIGGSIPENEADAAAPLLGPGQSVQGRTDTGYAPAATVGSFDDFYASNLYPVTGLPQTVKFAEQLSVLKSARAEGQSVVYGFSSLGATELFEICKRQPALQGAGIARRFAILREVAAIQVGEANAEELLAVWNDIAVVVEELSHLSEGGPILLLGGVNQRWLTRPLVPFPLELKAADRDYYRRFQFQAKGEEEAADLMNLQDNWMVKGFAARYIAEQIFNRALERIEDGRVRCMGLSGKTTDSAHRAAMELLGLRLSALGCLVRNAEDVCQYQEILDRTDLTRKPVETAIWHLPADPRGMAIREIVRREIDNTDELIRLLNRASAPLLKLAPSQAEEDVFLLGPDLPDQLHHKVRIMLEHEMDYDRLYSRFN